MLFLKGLFWSVLYWRFHFIHTGAWQNGDLRLRDCATSHSGRVEINLNSVWGTVDAGTDVSSQMGPAQTVVCRQLGYDGSSNYGTVSELGRANVHGVSETLPQ